MNAGSIFFGSSEALSLPEGNGFHIVFFALEGQIIISLASHGSPNVRKDLRADALSLKLTVHHEPADKSIVLFGAGSHWFRDIVRVFE